MHMNLKHKAEVKLVEVKMHDFLTIKKGNLKRWPLKKGHHVAPHVLIEHMWVTNNGTCGSKFLFFTTSVKTQSVKSDGTEHKWLTISDMKKQNECSVLLCDQTDLTCRLVTYLMNWN